MQEVEKSYAEGRITVYEISSLLKADKLAWTKGRSLDAFDEETIQSTIVVIEINGVEIIIHMKWSMTLSMQEM